MIISQIHKLGLSAEARDRMSEGRSTSFADLPCRSFPQWEPRAYWMSTSFLRGYGLVVTRHRLIQGCSPSFATMFGYEPDELAGRSLAILYPSNKEFVDIGKAGLKEMSASLRYVDNRIMKRRDGTYFWCQVVGQSTTPKDPFALCVWSFMDLSAHRPVVRLSGRELEIAMLWWTA